MLATVDMYSGRSTAWAKQTPEPVAVANTSARAWQNRYGVPWYLLAKTDWIAPGPRLQVSQKHALRWRVGMLWHCHARKRARLGSPGPRAARQLSTGASSAGARRCLARHPRAGNLSRLRTTHPAGSGAVNLAIIPRACFPARHHGLALRTGPRAVALRLGPALRMPCQASRWGTPAGRARALRPSAPAGSKAQVPPTACGRYATAARARACFGAA